MPTAKPKVTVETVPIRTPVTPAPKPKYIPVKIELRSNTQDFVKVVDPDGDSNSVYHPIVMVDPADIESGKITLADCREWHCDYTAFLQDEYPAIQLPVVILPALNLVTSPEGDKVAFLSYEGITEVMERQVDAMYSEPWQPPASKNRGLLKDTHDKLMSK